MRFLIDQDVYKLTIEFIRNLGHNVNIIHNELKQVLKEHAKEEFVSCFVVVERGRHRIRNTTAI